MHQFPDQLLPQKDKTPAWCSLHLDYAQDWWRSNNSNINKMNSDFQSWNGVKSPASIAYLTKTYGKENRAKYISYRAHAPKIQLRVGEFLTQPLAATVETINREAKSAKMKQVDFYYGAMVAKQEIQQLKDKVGVDVMEGADIPENEDDAIWDKISPKDKEESIMQIILNEQILADDLKIKFSNDNLNGQITSMCYGKVERDEEGETSYISLDPRDAIFQEVKGDVFLQKSTFLGAAPFLPIHDVLRRYKFTEKQVNLLKDIAANPSGYYSYPNGGMNTGIRQNGSNLLVQVLHLEWKSVIPTYYKKMPKTATQLAFDPSETHITIELDTESYEENKAWHDSQVAKGKYEIIAKYREDIWEGTRIGGMPELDINCRRAHFQMRSVDDPTRISGMSYCGYLFQTVDGMRVSLMNEMENLSNTFDIVMYQIFKEISKYKGTALGFNLAALQKDATIKTTVSELVNDGVITYDSSATGSVHGREVNTHKIVEQIDLGLSSTFGQLIQFKNDILSMMDRMTGINENREGQVSASATVSNTNSAIAASRTITAAFDYGFHLYISKVLTKIVESTKITWAFYKLEKGEQILGTNKFKYLQASLELGLKDYGVHLQDGRKYSEIKQFMQGLMEASLNAKEISQADALGFMVSETFAEQKAILLNAEAKVKEFQNQNQQAQIQNQQQMQQAQLQAQQEMAQADREDRQQNEKDNIILQGDTDIRVNNAKAGDKIVEQQHKSELDSINNENI